MHTAYFNGNGFIVAGTAPNNTYEQIVSRINAMAPYNPSEINSLTISFKE